MANYDDSESTDVPPVFKVQNPDEDAIEGNYEWDDDPIDCDRALLIAADFLGPETAAEVLARHWVHGGRAEDVRTMARRLSALYERLVGGSSAGGQSPRPKRPADRL